MCWDLSSMVTNKSLISFHCTLVINIRSHLNWEQLCHLKSFSNRPRTFFFSRNPCIWWLTYSGHHCPNKIKRPSKIPSGSKSIDPNSSSNRSLVLFQEGAQILQTDIERVAKVQEGPVPAPVGSQLGRALDGGKDRSAAQQVHDDEHGEQQKAPIVFVNVKGAAALQSQRRHHPDFSTTGAVDQCNDMDPLDPLLEDTPRSPKITLMTGKIRIKHAR